MACRHLNIRFLESGDVEYRFFRHHSETMLHRYVIEWPAEQTEILGGQCIEEHNFRRSINQEGFLLLEWDKVPESETGLGRGIDYVKRGYLMRPVNEPTLWHYREKFRIKPDFSIWLHSPFECINAIKRRSSATFQRTTGHIQTFSPWDLSRCVFNEPGLLSVDWILETLEKPRRSWR